MRILGIGNTINFQRRPTPDEEPDLKSTINKAYDIMDIKERTVITHGSCFPTLGRDSFIGSPYNKSAKEYIKFLSLYGFNGIQLGPGGELQKGSISPYNSSAFAKNKLFIDLEELTTDKYCNILSTETYNKVTQSPKISNKNYDISDFTEAEQTYNTALRESYKNFRTKLFNGNPEVQQLNKEFCNFKKVHGTRLNDEAVFKILSDEYGTDKFEQWHNELDENLISEYGKGNKQAFERYKQLSVDNSIRIEQYKFEQFIATKQIKENKEWRDKLGFKYINDLLVGCSKMDEWRYKDAFLQDWEMGAKEYNSQSQRWHIPIIDPKKIMLENNKLNIGGKFFKEKIEYALEFSENIRVDHVMGLIEPYIMSKSADNKDFTSSPNKNKDVEMYISELKDSEGNEYDFYWDYPKLLERIILPTMKEHGITKDMAMWEDICSYPERFRAVYKQLELPRISFTDWERAEISRKNEPDNWFLLSNHDNIPAMNYLKRKNQKGEEYTKSQSAWNPMYLAGYLHQNPKRSDERNAYYEKITSDDRELVFAKFSELMTTPKFQISFDDLLGITDAVYNIPGTNNQENWKERISSDFLDKYYENLSGEKPTALNIPELLATALKAKLDMEPNPDELYEKYQPIINKLEHYAEVLKESDN